MEEIVIRRAVPADADLIAAMSRQTFYDSFAASNTQADMDKFMHEQFSKEKLMLEVENGDGIFFIAYNEKEALGYVRMRNGDKYPAFAGLASIEVARIYAVQSAIGKGIGSRLIKKCIDTAVELDRKIIWLGVWEHNQRAIDFYKKWGFEKFGSHEFVLGTDVQTDWLMMKHL